jgi:hypothetical protein
MAGGAVGLHGLPATVVVGFLADAEGSDGEGDQGQNSGHEDLGHDVALRVEEWETGASTDDGQRGPDMRKGTTTGRAGQKEILF